MKPQLGRGPRRRMNVVGVCVGLFVPWIIFCIIFSIMCFSLHYTRPLLCLFVIVVFFVVVLGFGFCALDALRRKRSGDLTREPTWYIFLFIASLVAWIAAVWLGELNYNRNFEPFYEVNTLGTYASVDPLSVRGQQIMDAGRVIFTEGSRLDLTKSIGFKSIDVYCVAPVTRGDGPMATYDFWAVGINCCSGNEADFHCADFNNPNAYAGLRLMDDDSSPYYRLAVQQAEAAYGVKSVHPLFFHWMQDPVSEMANYQDEGFKYYFLAVFTHFSVQLFMVTLAVIAFSKMTVL